jgi:hypothetical protein
VVLLGGCDDGSGPPPTPTVPRLTPRALDAQQQRIVADYQPVSYALTGYEIAFRDTQAGRLSRARLVSQARRFRAVVTASIARIRRDRATGATAEAKALLLRALAARRLALGALVEGDRPRYQKHWNRSAALARRALTKLQDVRDEARLIPLPEDSIS